MKEFFKANINEGDDKVLQEKVLRNQSIPNGAGITYGELFKDAANNNELEPGDTFFTFYERVKAAQEKNDDRETIDSYRDAA